MTKNLVGTWGAFMFTEDVSPQSQALFEHNTMSGVTMPCVEEKGEEIALSYKGQLYWGAKKAFNLRPIPEFTWDDKVRVLNKNVIATIDLICWHYNDKNYFYFVRDIETGKQLKKRYYPKDMERVQ